MPSSTAPDTEGRNPLPALTPVPGAATLAIPTLALHTEDITIRKQRVVSGTVRVQTVTRSHDQLVEEPLLHERVEVERIAMNRPVDAVPPVRVEGDTTIVSVVEEVVVVERRLMLREEVRIRRVQVTATHRESVSLREQDVVVTRLAPDPQAASGAQLPFGVAEPGSLPSHIQEPSS